MHKEILEQQHIMGGWGGATQALQESPCREGWNPSHLRNWEEVKFQQDILLEEATEPLSFGFNPFSDRGGG